MLFHIGLTGFCAGFVLFIAQGSGGRSILRQVFQEMSSLPYRAVSKAPSSCIVSCTVPKGATTP